MLWQPLDQCPIAIQAVNLKEQIFSGNTSCVFTRKLDREPQQYFTYYLYKVSMVCATTMHCPTLMSMPCPHGHYLSAIHLPQGQHAMSICPDIILFNFRHHACTMCTPWGTHVPWHHSNPKLVVATTSRNDTVVCLLQQSSYLAI